MPMLPRVTRDRRRKCLGIEVCQASFSRSKGFFFLAEREAHLGGAVLCVVVDAGPGYDGDSAGFDEKLGEAPVFRIGLESARSRTGKARDVAPHVERAARR